jgi:tetratricopeptide (TPR) repeat protein
MRELDAEERMRLESLGYLVSEVPREAGEIGVVGGLDPKDHVHEVDRISQASTWLALGRPERALDELEGLSTITTRVLYLRARAAGELGRLDLVEQAAEEMLRRDPDDSMALSTLAVALSGSGRADQARRTLERALARHPDDPQLVIAQARVAEAEGELETAAALYIRAEGMGEDSGEARHCLAVVRLRQGRVADADALVSGLPEVFIQHPSLGTRLGAAYLDAGRPERAAQLLARTARANPHVPRVKQLRAAALSAAGRHEEALAVTRRAYALEPDEATAANDLAWALAIVGRDLDRALELAREAADALPEEAAALDTLATVHLVRGEHADALATAHRALPGAPAPIGRHLHYVEAEALAGLGRTQEARSALQVLAREGGGLERPWAERAEALEHRMARAVAGGD